MYKLMGAVALSLAMSGLVTADEGTDKLDNPKPLPDDVSLPLPCEGQMVFRYVYILAQGTLDDREISLGYPFSEGEAGYQQSFISASPSQLHQRPVHPQGFAQGLEQDHHAVDAQDRRQDAA